jgi:hypothetical protein
VGKGSKEKNVIVGVGLVKDKFKGIKDKGKDVIKGVGKRIKAKG